MTVPWQERYATKIKAADMALANIKRGANVFVGSGATEPRRLVAGLVDLARRWDAEALHVYALEADRGLLADLRCRRYALSQPQASEGAIPVPLLPWQLGRLLKSAELHVDVAMIMVTPPDEHGFCSLGLGVSYAKSVLAYAEHVIAEVNPQLAWSWGESLVHVDRIDAFVLNDAPLQAYPAIAPNELDAEVARRVAELVPEGGTLQLDAGAIGAALCGALSERRGLGLHAEALTPAMMPAIETGVFSGVNKTLYPGKAVASRCMGTLPLYEFVRDNPLVEFYPLDHLADPTVVGRNARLMAVNTADWISLAGIAELPGTAACGQAGVLGYIQGAARSDGGAAVLVLRAADERGRSRIVLERTSAHGCQVALNEIDHVVTEYGVAHLTGKGLTERTIALIEVAHPDRREMLFAQAKSRGWVRETEQWPVGRYPGELELETIVRGGLKLRVRPVKLSDQRMLRDLFYALSPGSLYFRFFRVPKSVPGELVRHAERIDYERELALVGLVQEGGRERIVAVSRYVIEESGMADVALLVQDDYQRRGIGFAMLKYLGAAASQRGVAGLKADVLVGNQGALNLVTKFGFQVETVLRSGYYTLSYHFE